MRKKHGFRRAPWCYIDYEGPMPWRLRCEVCGEGEDFEPPVTLLGTLGQCERFSGRHFSCGTDAMYVDEPPPDLPVTQIGMSESAYREFEELAGRDPIWRELERLFVVYPEPSHLRVWICERPPGRHADGVQAECSRCQAPIVHRPWFPKDAVMMCASCAAAPGVIE